MRRFFKDEEGAVLVMGLYFFVIMLIVVGIAVDMAHHENTRIRLQQTLDRAILAATNLNQTMPAEEVVRDYFNKNGLNDDEHITAIQVDERLNYRSVTANAAVTVDTFFALGQRPEEEQNGFVELSDWYNYMGEASWIASAKGGAEQGYTDIEISLIVDVSGSMNSYSRIDNLKVAAKEFVDAVMINEPGADNLVTLSMVPYSAVVNIGSDMTDIYNVSDVHNFSHCPTFDRDDFNSPGIDHTQELGRVAHFERGSGVLIDNPWCPTAQFRGNAVLPFATDPEVVKDAIDALQAYGNTAIDLGMKWGTALLDPAARPVADELVERNLISHRVTGRPYDYGQRNNLKIVVLMTDGQNTSQYDLREPYKSGMSPVWVTRQYAGQSLWQLMADTDGDMSHLSYRFSDGGTPLDHTDDKFMRYGSASQVLSHPHGYEDYDNAPSADYDYETDGAYTSDHSGLTERLSWAEIFATWNEGEVYAMVGQEPYDYEYIDRTTYRAPRSETEVTVNGTQADERLNDICNASKNEGNIVYTIAFEAPDAGQAALQSCASSDATYFDVDSTDISAAFASIATDITKLQLTQ